MIRLASYRYRRALAFFIGAIAVFVVTADWLMINHQRETMLEEARNNTKSELDLIGTIAREALLKRDYITVENFLEQWGKEHKSVAMAQAISSNGFVLARYHRSAPAKYPYYVQYPVRYGDRELVRLKVVKDFESVERSLDKVIGWLIVLSVILSVSLIVVLWRTLGALAFKPLENEIKRTEDAVRLVVEGTASHTGDDFFRSLVHNLASSIGVKSAFAAELVDNSACRARTIAMWMGDRIVDNMVYDLAGTPCEEVYEGKTSYYPDDVQRHFPEDIALADIGARSYLGIPFFDSGGNVAGHLGVLDVRPMNGRKYIEPIVRLFATRVGAELERVRAEEKLNQFKTTLDMTLDCVFMFDPDTLRFIYVNQGAVDQVGYGREELLKMTPLDVKPDFSEEQFREMIAPLMSGAAPWKTFETTHLSKKGDRLPVEIFLQHVKLPGESGRFVAIVRDISERRKTEEALRQTQKLESLGVLAGGIAHDFNNILVGILGNANMALEDVPVSSPARECVEDVILSAKQAADLARQMLAYSGKGKIIIKPVSLVDIIREMSHLLEVSISKKVSLKYRLPDGLPSIEGDPSQIRQVVMNLVINASEAMEGENGAVEVNVGRMKVAGGLPINGNGVNGRGREYVFLEVTDNGCGMDTETLERIFDPFFTTKFTGRGLGLAAVSGIVRGHNGDLKVYSEPGKGTTFKALFPAKNVAAQSLSENSIFSNGHNGGGRVLVVDDELTIRNVARKMLKRAGYTVVTADDGSEAVDILRKEPHDIDVVLLDMTMPRMDGARAFQKMREIRPDMRIILSSGYNEQDAASRFAGKGLAGFIQKPYTNDLLLEKVSEALQSKV